MRGGISLSLVLGGLLAVGAVAGLVFLLSQVQAVNWREHYEVRDAIRELQELDMQLNVRLLMARQDLPQEEHAVARVQALMRETEERIFADIMASGTIPRALAMAMSPHWSWSTTMPRARNRN